MSAKTRRVLATGTLAMTLLMVAGSLAWADVYGTIRGTLRDDQGNPLPGAAVSVRSPALIRQNVSALTDEKGRFRIDVLPVGTYTVSTALPGFATSIRENIKLNMNETVTLDIVLTPTSLEQTVTVTAAAPIIDVTRTQISETIDSTAIATLPINDRDFTRFIQLQPGVVANNNGWKGYEQSVLGGEKHESGWMIDGLENSNEQGYGMRGYEHNFNLDIFEEYQLILTGFNAEYGRASAGVTKIITKSGGNDFHGGIGGYFKNNSLATGLQGQTVPEFRRWDLSLNLGGPIIKDKLWFFAAYQRTDEELGVYWNIAAVPTNIKDGEDFSVVPTRKEHLLFLKLTQNIGNRDKLVVSFNYDPRNEFGAFLGGGSLPSTAETTTVGGLLVYGTYTHIFGQNAYLDVSAQYNKGGFSSVQKNAQMGQAFPNYTKGFNYGNNTNLDEDRRQVKADFSLFREDWLGDHEFKAGIDYNYVHMGGGPSREWLPLYMYTVDDSSAQPVFKREYTGVLTSNVNAANYGLYFQDSWTVNPYITLNLGLRYDYADLVKESGVNDGNDVAPRVGFTWDLTRDHKTALRAHWGRFYDQIWLNEMLNQPQFGGRTIITNIYRWSGADWQFMYSSGRIRDMWKPFRTPYNDGFNIGVQRELLTDLSVEIQYVNRKARGQMHRYTSNWLPDNSGRTTDGGPPVGMVGFIGKADYNAVMINATKRFRDSYSFNIGYTYSRLKDLKSNPYDSFDDDNNWDKDWGWSSRDVRHSVFANGVFILPYGIELGMVLQARSGFPFTPSGQADIDNDGSFERPSVNGVQLARNTYRMPGYFRTDLSIQKAFYFGRSRLTAVAYLFNATNKANVNSVSKDMRSEKFQEPLSWYPGLLAQFGLKLEF